MQAELDRNILAIDRQHPDRWESFVVRPWMVVDSPPKLSYVLSNCYILRIELAAAMVDAALNGSNESLLDNAPLREKGQQALSSKI